MFQVRELDVAVLRNAVARLIVEANYNIPADILDALRAAVVREESALGRRTLEQLVRNYELAAVERVPVCQDSGVAVVLLLYLFVVGRCLWIAMDARDTYSRLLAGTLGMALFVYVIVNGGMVSGLLPVVGVPMPLLSYGGTSAVSLLAGLGLVMAVRAHRPVHGY